MRSFDDSGRTTSRVFFAERVGFFFAIRYITERMVAKNDPKKLQRASASSLFSGLAAHEFLASSTDIPVRCEIVMGSIRLFSPLSVRVPPAVVRFPLVDPLLDAGYSLLKPKKGFGGNDRFRDVAGASFARPLLRLVRETGKIGSVPEEPTSEGTKIVLEPKLSRVLISPCAQPESEPRVAAHIERFSACSHTFILPYLSS